MSETKPYAGPWHVGPHYKSDVESLHGRVAEACPHHTAQGDANARLIAAAPELLDTLRKNLDTFNDTATVLGLLGHHTSAEAMLIAATYTATVIAKAEGR